MRIIGKAFKALKDSARKFLALYEKTRLQAAICAGFCLVFLLVLGLFSPLQLPVVLYKLLCPCLGGMAAVFLWRALVPIGDPARWLALDWREDPDNDAPDSADFSLSLMVPEQIAFMVSLLCTGLAFAAGMLSVGWAL